MHLNKFTSILPLLVFFSVFGFLFQVVEAENSICATTFQEGPAIETSSEMFPQPFVTVASTSDSDIKIAVDQITAADGGTLYFPAGTYVLQRNPSSVFNSVETRLYFDGMNELKIIGDGAATILEIAPDLANFYGSQVRNINIENTERVEISHLNLQGQRDLFAPPGFPKTGEFEWAKSQTPLIQNIVGDLSQQSNIFIRNVHGETYLHDLILRHAGGDGINIADATNIIIENNDIDDMGRNGVTIGGERTSSLATTERSVNVLIQHNYFGSSIDTQQVDIEQHSDSPYQGGIDFLNSNIRVKHNFFEKIAPEDLIDREQFAMTFSLSNMVEFSHNIVNGNPVSGIHASNVRILNNTGIGGMRFHRDNTSLLVENNIFDMKPLARRNWPSFNNGGINIMETGTSNVPLFVFRGNTLYSDGIKWPIHLHNVINSYIENNVFLTTGETDSVRVTADRTDASINFSDNGIANLSKFSRPDFSLIETSDSAENCNFLEPVFWVEHRNTVANYPESGSELQSNDVSSKQWLSDAISYQRLRNNGKISWRVPATDKSVMVGLQSENTDQRQDGYEFGIYTYQAGSVYIVENGKLGSRIGSFQANDQFSMERANGFVTYKQNGTIIGFSAHENHDVLMADSAIATTGGRITDCWTSNFNPPSTPVQWKNQINTIAVYPPDVGSDIKVQPPTSSIWNFDAVSTRHLQGDGAVSWQVAGADVTAAVGLQQDNTSRRLDDMEYGIYTYRSGYYFIIENGVLGERIGSFLTNDVFEIERIDGVVRYIHNGVLVHTSTKVNSQPLMVDVAFVRPGGRIKNATSWGFTKSP